MARPLSGFGIGLRGPHVADLLALPPNNVIDWLEIVPENWLYFGGKRRRGFDACQERWPMVSHSVSLNIGGQGELDKEFVELVSEFSERVGAPFFSDHLVWSSVANRPVHDLIPLPMSDESVEHIAKRCAALRRQTQHPLVLENATFYSKMPGSHLDEGTFIHQALEQANVGLLLDVNNVYVNAQNQGLSARDIIDAMPLHRVQQIHLAGHTKEENVIIDTHIGPTPEPVWELYAYALSKLKRLPPTLIEWDQDIPPLPTMLNEIERARQVAASVGVWSQS